MKNTDMRLSIFSAKTIVRNPRFKRYSQWKVLPCINSGLYFLSLTLMLLVIVPEAIWGQSSQIYTSNNTFTVPSGVTSITVEAWGGGGAGGGVYNGFSGSGYGGGGAGGAFVRKVVNTQLPSYAILVGAGGKGVDSDNGEKGSNSTFGATLVVASGGEGGHVGDNDIGAGGAATAGTYAGGAGADGNNNYQSRYGGAGGGGAGNIGTGGNASGTAGGTGGIGFTGSTNGGTGAAGRTSNGNGNSATTLSAGGGGAMVRNAWSSYAGGAGFHGQVIIYYYILTNLTSTIPVCAGSPSTVNINATATNLPIGNYTVTYDLGAPNSATGLIATMTVTSAGSGTFTTSALASSGTTTVTVSRLSSEVITGGIGANNTTNIVVNTPSVGGTAFSNQSICSGSSPADITLTGNTGNIQWQSSVNNVTFDNITGANTSTLKSTQLGTLTTTRYYRAVITSGVCSSKNSSLVTVTVNPLPNFSISKTNITCYNAGDGTITITANGADTYLYSINNGSTYPYNGTSPKIITDLSNGEYKIRIKNANGCESVLCP